MQYIKNDDKLMKILFNKLKQHGKNVEWTDKYYFIDEYHNDINDIYDGIKNNMRVEYTIGTKKQIYWLLHKYFMINKNDILKEETKEEIQEEEKQELNIEEKIEILERKRFKGYKYEVRYLILFLKINKMKFDYFMNCLIFTNEKQISEYNIFVNKIKNDNMIKYNDNYMFLDEKKQECYYYIEFSKYKLMNNNRYIRFPKNVYDIINESIKIYPRKYLLQKKQEINEPISKEEFYKIMKKNEI